MITYEFPLNERTRSMLRLEDLYDRLLHFVNERDPRDHHTALVTLFELAEVVGRADLKLDLVQELERQRQALEAQRHNPQIAQDALTNALGQIEQAEGQLLAVKGKLGQHLRENEWLTSIKHRTGIPGGACEFDLPAYHYWLNADENARRNDLTHWIAPLLPMHTGLSIVLNLLRKSAETTAHVATSGNFQMLMAGRSAQLIELRVNENAPYVPEIGANKYALNIRFLTPDTAVRPRQAEVDVPFELAFCSL